MIKIYNNIFTKVSILNITKRKMFYTIIFLINCLFYCEQFVFNAVLIGEVNGFNLNGRNMRMFLEVVLENYIVVFIVLGIIVLEYDIFESLQIQNITEYKVMYECGLSKKAIFAHKFLEYIILDFTGFCVSMITLLFLNYDNVSVLEFAKLLLICTVAKHFAIGVSCFKTSRF